MSGAAPADPAADRNLLFGILAVQMDFVSRDNLIGAMHAWVLTKHRPLGEILAEQGPLTPDRRLLLDALVAEHLKAHGGDALRSLAAVAHRSTLGDLAQSVADPDLQGTLAAAGATLATTADYQPAEDGLRYRVLRPHAQGGLGVVSVARDAELGREVAFKEIQTRYSGDATQRGRFVREAEITGGLEHPGIVPVYGLGRYADGRPFYAMRFIRGESLQEATRKLHAGESGYTLRGLLTRFVAVCNAVGYAHSRGVIHRDLKPANVMLGPYGETLVVDWGLAKVVGREPGDGESLAEGTLRPPFAEDSLTQAGSHLGTPAFMSPEQAGGEVTTLGPATDVYSLGATLYAVLTGRPPVQGRDTPEVLENVRRRNWPPPAAVRPAVPKALDAVCCKAMALKPSDRYASALDLAADVERQLADEPVTAWREPWPTRAGRWVRRHRQLATGVAALLLAAVPLSVVIAVNSDQARQRAERDERAIREQKEVAEANEAETQAVLDFVENKVFAAARPKDVEGGLGSEVTLRRAVQTALPFVEQSFRQQPLIEARLRMTLGRSFWYLGDAKIATGQFLAARTIFSEHLGPDHLDTLRSMTNLANSYADLGRYAESLKLNEEILALQKAKLGPDHPDTLWSMNNLAANYADLGRHAGALKLNEETLALRKAKLGPDHPDTLCSMHNLAHNYSGLHRYVEAVKLYEQTLALRKAKLGPDHPDTLWSMNGLALSYAALGRHAEALKLHEQTLALRKAKLGPDHPDTLKSMNGLANGYNDVGRYAEALKLHEQALALQQAKLGPDHPDTLSTMNNLAISYARLGRLTEALKLHEQTLALQQAKLDPDHPATLRSMYNIACIHALMSSQAADRGKQADLAMDWLKRAVAAGYKNTAQIKKDTDLDALRGRQDFKKLLADLEASQSKDNK
jgi:tetratricopeptide (TPR) repeat protein